MRHKSQTRGLVALPDPSWFLYPKQIAIRQMIEIMICCRECVQAIGGWTFLCWISTQDQVHLACYDLILSQPMNLVLQKLHSIEAQSGRCHSSVDTFQSFRVPGVGSRRDCRISCLHHSRMQNGAIQNRIHLLKSSGWVRFCQLGVAPHRSWA